MMKHGDKTLPPYIYIITTPIRPSTAWDRRLEPLQDIPRQAGVYPCQVIIIVIIKSHPPRHQNHHHNHHDDQADQVTVHCLVCLKALSPHLAFPGEDDDGHDGDDGDDFAPSW